MALIHSAILDIKYHIASCDSEAWYHLYQYDPEFREYARSQTGMRRYAQLFTEDCTSETHKGTFVRDWWLLDKLHREPDINGNSLPAVIKSNGTMRYYINGQLHRNGDLPAITNKIVENYQDNIFNPEDFDESSYHEDYTDDENDSDEQCEKGIICYYKNDELHRDDDQHGNSQPAIIQTDGSTNYYKNGVLHRDHNQPAVIKTSGTLKYYRDGELHRDDDIDGTPLPSICHSDGGLEYYKNGKRHRNDDQPAVMKSNGTIKYYIDGKQHRSPSALGECRPAVIKRDGTVKYYLNGLLHREGDFPAIERCFDYIDHVNGDTLDDTSDDNRVDSDEHGEFDSWSVDPENSDDSNYNDDSSDFGMDYCKKGTIKYYKHGKLHRDNDVDGNDRPAVIHVDGGLDYCIDGKFHRVNDQPACIEASGIRRWFINGKLHRDNNLPAIIYADGSCRYYQYGECQKDDNQSSVINMIKNATL